MTQSVADRSDDHTDASRHSATPGRSQAALVVLGILLAAAVVRLVFFSGFQGRDDRNYAAYAISLAENHHFPAEIQTQWVGRIGHWLPIAGVLAIGGVSEFTLGFYSLICSLIGIVATYGIGRLLFNHHVAALGAFLLAVFPLDVIYSTTAYTDVPVATFMLVALGAMLKGACSARPFRWFLMAGLATGMAYLCRPTAVAMLPCLAMIGWSGGRRKAALAMPAGLLLVIVAEAAFWQGTTGDFLHGIHAAQAKQVQNRQEESSAGRQISADSTSEVLSWIPGPRPWERYRSDNSLLDLALMFVTNQEFGLYFVVAASLLLVRSIRRDLASRWLFVWIVTNTLILAFFPFNLPRHTLPRDPRYYACLSGPVCLCLAAGLSRCRPTFRLLTCSLLFVSSLACVGIDSSRLAMDDARQLATVFTSHPQWQFWMPPRERFAIYVLNGGGCDDRLGVHTLTTHPDSDSFISLRLICPQLPVARGLKEMGDGSLILPDHRDDLPLEENGWQLAETVVAPRSALRGLGFQWGQAIGIENKYLQRLFPGGGPGFGVWNNNTHVRL